MVELKEERLRKSLSEAKNHWQGQKDLNPRHAVLERLLKVQNRIDKPLFKPKLEHQNCIFVILMLY
mgnify:FL=1